MVVRGSNRYAPLRFVRSAPVRSAPPRSAPLRSASLRFAPLRSRPVRSGPVRSFEVQGAVAYVVRPGGGRTPFSAPPQRDFCGGALTCPLRGQKKRCCAPADLVCACACPSREALNQHGFTPPNLRNIYIYMYGCCLLWFSLRVRERARRQKVVTLSKIDPPGNKHNFSLLSHPFLVTVSQPAPLPPKTMLGRHVFCWSFHLFFF